jgi:hypothetical protein
VRSGPHPPVSGLKAYDPPMRSTRWGRLPAPGTSSTPGTRLDQRGDTLASTARLPSEPNGAEDRGILLQGFKDRSSEIGSQVQFPLRSVGETQSDPKSLERLDRSDADHRRLFERRNGNERERSARERSFEHFRSLDVHRGLVLRVPGVKSEAVSGPL